MRTFGSPSGSTVASATAFGSLISLPSASFSHVPKREKGSFASVKSPLVNSFTAILPSNAVMSGAETLRDEPERCFRIENVRACLLTSSGNVRLLRV
ncbi:hypothetical protein D3C71_1921390 [compost metagenome]